MRTKILTAVTAALAAAPALAQDIVINEIRIDDPGTDTGEFFELLGAPGTSLDGLSYITIGDGTGASGVVEEVTDLTGSVIPASGYFLCVHTSATDITATADLVTSLQFENSDNVTHLLVSGFTGVAGDDLDLDDDGNLDVTPWTAVLDQVAVAETLENPPTTSEFFYGNVIAGPDGTFVPGHVFRGGDSTGPLTAWCVGIFDNLAGLDTPGAPNAAAGRLPSAFGGGLGLSLNFGAGSAGDFYLIAATLSGTAPGLPIGGQIIPLNPDAFFNLSLNTNSGPFVNTFGTLDADGRGAAQIVLPSGLPATLAGATIDVAAVTISTTTFGLDQVSNNGSVALD